MPMVVVVVSVSVIAVGLVGLIEASSFWCRRCLADLLVCVGGDGFVGGDGSGAYAASDWRCRHSRCPLWSVGGVRFGAVSCQTVCIKDCGIDCADVLADVWVVVLCAVAVAIAATVPASNGIDGGPVGF